MAEQLSVSDSCEEVEDDAMTESRTVLSVGTRLINCAIFVMSTPMSSQGVTHVQVTGLGVFLYAEISPIHDKLANVIAGLFEEEETCTEP